MSAQTIRPYVILNVAVTADGKIDTAERMGAAISSDEDAERVDQLRSEVDAILVGGRTLLENDPRLTIKSDKLRQERILRGLDANPIKIGVVTKADLDQGSRFLTYGPARVMIFTTEQTQPTQVKNLEKWGARVLVRGREHVDLTQMMQQLHEAGIKRMLTEGGGTLNESLLRMGYIDEIYIYVAPMIFGGATAPTFVDGQGLKGENAIVLELIEVRSMAGGGLLIHYKPDYGQ